MGYYIRSEPHTNGAWEVIRDGEIVEARKVTIGKSLDNRQEMLHWIKLKNPHAPAHAFFGRREGVCLRFESFDQQAENGDWIVRRVGNKFFVAPRKEFEGAYRPVTKEMLLPPAIQ